MKSRQAVAGAVLRQESQENELNVSKCNWLQLKLIAAEDNPPRFPNSFLPAKAEISVQMNTRNNSC